MLVANEDAIVVPTLRDNVPGPPPLPSPPDPTTLEGLCQAHVFLFYIREFIMFAFLIVYVIPFALSSVFFLKCCALVALWCVETLVFDLQGDC